MMKKRLRNKYKCDRSEDDDEESNLKEFSNDDEKKEDKNAECLAADGNEENQLTRTSCHDSGIDIRDSVPTVPVIPTKKVIYSYFIRIFLTIKSLIYLSKQVYSDADIVLSSDWVPPLTIAPASISTDTKSQASSSQSQETVSTSSDGRKKTSSVSFSVEDNENSVSEKGTGEVKKNKVNLIDWIITLLID